MSQQDGEKHESEKRSQNKAAAKSECSDKNRRGAVAKLIVKKIDQPTETESGTTKIRPEPRRPRAMPLVEVDQDDSAEKSDTLETEEVSRLVVSHDQPPSVIKSQEVTLAKFEKREPRPSEDVKQEEQWNENKSIGWWVAIGGACLVLILVAAVLLSSQWDADGMQQVEAPQIVLPTTESPFAGTPEEWFRERAGKIASQAAIVLQGYAAAKNDQERSRWVRNPEKFLKNAPTWMGKIQPRPGDHNQSGYEIGHIENTGYLVLKTEDQDFMPMRLYFVRSGEELKIDWEASTAWSEMSFDEIRQKQSQYEKQVSAVRKQAAKDQAVVHEAYLQKMQQYRKTMDDYQRRHHGLKHTVVAGESLKSIAARYGLTADELVNDNGLKGESLEIGQIIKLPAKTGAGSPAPAMPQKPSPPQSVEELELPARSFQEEVLVRCLMRRRNEFYAGPYNDVEHSSFMIASSDRRQTFWAYVERDSMLDLELRGLLDHGSFVVALKKDVLVTLRVRSGKKDALPSQLEVVELVHPEWLTP